MDPDRLREEERMAGSKSAGKKSSSKAAAGTARMTPWQVGQLTGKLAGDLKNVQVAYIRVGIGFVRVRDEKFYLILRNPDLADYVLARLHLATASLYRYLQVHDWIKASHPEWLEPHPKGRVPDLTDATDLMWIERQLSKKGMAPETTADLKGLQEKALDGRLKKGELSRYRRQGRQSTDATLKSLLAKLRLLRRQAERVKSTPPEALAKLDDAIEIVLNAVQSHPISVALGDDVVHMLAQRYAT
jgi:hypothetical protein